MQVYQLDINGKTVLEVDIDHPAWLGSPPKLNVWWLKRLLCMALALHFSR
jgi:hypothetical protein